MDPSGRTNHPIEIINSWNSNLDQVKFIDAVNEESFVKNHGMELDEALFYPSNPTCHL